MQINTNRRSLLTGAGGIVAAGVGIATTSAALASQPSADSAISPELRSLIAAHLRAKEDDCRVAVIHDRTRTRESARASDRANEANSDAQWDVMQYPCRNIHELHLKLEKAKEYEILDDAVAELLGPIVLDDVRRIVGGEA